MNRDAVFGLSIVKTRKKIQDNQDRSMDFDLEQAAYRAIPSDPRGDDDDEAQLLDMPVHAEMPSREGPEAK